jgi:phosphoglycolate phosphatase
MNKLLPIIKEYKQVIWDWNGTLIDDLDKIIDSIGHLLIKNSLPLPSKERFRSIFNIPVEPVYVELGFDLEKTPFAELADDFIEQYDRRVLEASLFHDTVEMLEAIKAAGITQSVLSAGEHGRINQLVSHHKIDHFFDKIWGIEDIYAMSKLERGREFIAQSTVAASESLMIGDTIHDCEVGEAMGVDVLLVGDGYQSVERLKEHHHRVLPSRY